MSDRWAVVLAIATFAGALAAVDGHVGRVPLAAPVVAVGLAWVLYRGGRFRPELLVLEPPGRRPGASPTGRSTA